MNYYEELEVSRNASQEVIRAAYKSLIQRFHPDKNGGKTHERLPKIIAAYKVLSDPAAKDIYDEKLFGEKENRTIETQALTTAVNGKESTPHQNSKKIGNGKFLFFSILVVAVLALGAIEKVRREKSESEMRKLYAEIEERNEKEERLKREQDQIEKEEIEKSDLLRRTGKLFPELLVIELNQSSPSKCALRGEFIEFPPVTIVFGKWDFEKVRASYLSAINIIKYNTIEDIKSTSACEFLQVDIKEKIEQSIQKISNKVLFGEQWDYLSCRNLRKQLDGTYDYDYVGYGTGQDEIVCRGIATVTLEAPIRVR